jgi:hypothetical protein
MQTGGNLGGRSIPVLAVEGPDTTSEVFVNSQTLPVHTHTGLLLLLFLGGLALPSCSGSGSLHAVHGKVLYKDEPIKGAVVFFHPQGNTDVNAQHPSGVTGEDGTFTLMTGNQKGAPAGDYVVTVVWNEEVEAPKKIVMNPDDVPAPKDRLGGRYANQAASKLTAKVKSGNNVLEPFKLD